MDTIRRVFRKSFGPSPLASDQEFWPAFAKMWRARLIILGTIWATFLLVVLGFVIAVGVIRGN